MAGKKSGWNVKKLNSPFEKKECSSVPVSSSVKEKLHDTIANWFTKLYIITSFNPSIAILDVADVRDLVPIRQLKYKKPW